MANIPVVCRKLVISNSISFIVSLTISYANSRYSVNYYIICIGYTFSYFKSEA